MIRQGFNAINKEMKNINSKIDICLMNQEKLNRFLLPGKNY